ncbi:aminophospholipid-transporting P-type ATPase [Cerioporus squamosus]|nr:aminophospholipid-transporting P-type ATPase [Cerioporus squamosus]
METDNSSEKHVPDEEAIVAARAVAFDNDGADIQEKAPHGMRPKGVEMKREMTKEDKELADAGYEHLKHQKPGGQKEGDGKLDSVDIHEHGLGFQELQTELDTTFDAKDPSSSLGLSSEEAKARLSRNGPNILTPPKKKSALRKYYDCLMSMFNILLIIAGILEYILLGVNFKDNFANTYLGGILIGVAFLNALIEFYQLQKSEAILASFLAMIPPSCRVVRDGTLNTVPAADLVKGDIVLVRSGDKTPADLILFSASDLKVDNSSLTGESEPQERLARPAGVQQRVVEAENLLFNSTLIVNGEGWGGQIAALTGTETGKQSPLGAEIGHFVMMVSGIAIVFAVVFFVVGITTAYKGKGEQTVTFAVSILVAFVPEGLPSVVTLLLSIAAKRMAAQNVLVKDLQGVETLGSLTLLATDKTGTLTRNQMTVTNLWSGLRMFSAFQSNNDSETTETFSIEAPGMREMVDIAALNSHVKFDKTDIPFEQRKILGDATETGLIRFAGKHISDYDGYQKQHPRVFEIPFNSSNKWALVILEKPHKTGLLTAYLKGAPERVLAKCSTYLKDGKEVPITDDFKAAYDEAYDYMASRGHRVIACAQKLLPGDVYDSEYEFNKNDAKYPSTEYCFCGLISLEDPPKHGVREAIGTLRLAGIKVMMVTGDHPKTAEAIARKINLILGDTKESLSKKTDRPIEEIYDDEVDAIVIHGDDIDGLQGWQWDQIFAKNEIVFARTSPKHKLEIVKRAQALGHIVGVDGSHRMLTSLQADLGIAMNISGSDVSKEAANMILLEGVAEGRQIFVNLKRSIQYTISHSTPEVIPQLLYVVVPLPLPLSAILILVIDLGFELFVALSFAWDKPETKDGLMRMLPAGQVLSDRSIMTLKKRALRRTKTLLRDPETQEVIQPSKFSVFMTKLKAPFTRMFWEEALERTDDETLVDAKLLSYAYLEAGLIEFAGALAAYFVVFFKNGFTPGDLQRAQSALTAEPPVTYFQKDSPDFLNSRGQRISGEKQVDALAQAQSIVYLSIFIIQCFNVFAVKAKFRFPFGKSIVGNYYNFAGIVAGACLGMFIVYTPPLHVVFGGSVHLSPLYWLIPVGFGVLLLVWSSIRVLLMRKGIEQSRVKDIKGLMMFPTMRTMSMRSKH